jgi:hypothetical protein
MPTKNRHGLSRDIPEDVKRVVRQRDGFGCVICGNAIYTYEHFDPEFADASVHDPAGITLLCGGCHDRKTRGLLSKQSVASAMADPKCEQTGFSFGPFDVGSDPPKLQIGSVAASNVRVVIRASGDELLSIEPPEEDGGPFRVSAQLANRDGTEIIRITRNEWSTPTSNWDVQVEGSRITIHNGPGDVAVVRSDPPAGLVVERLDMFHKGTRLVANEKDGFVVEGVTGASVAATGGFVDGGDVAIDILDDGSIAIGKGSESTQLAAGTVIDMSKMSTPGASISLGGTRGTSDPSRPAPQPTVRSQPKTPRNARCPCGSGKKFKVCHGRP